MAEPMAKVTVSFSPILNGTGGANAIQVLAALSRLRKGIGNTQEEVVKASGLQEADALQQLAGLEEQKLVRSFLCQEGTAGPFARRYKLADNIEINVSVSRPA